MIEALREFIDIGSEAILTVVLLFLVALGVMGSFGILARAVVPGLMTSTGIFGTFWGIITALKTDTFLTGDHAAVESVLSGMTAAFSTSLAGLFFAIAFKAFWSSKYFVKKDTSQAQEGIADRLDEIKMAIRESGEQSLSQRMQELHDESKEGFGKIANLADTIENSLAKSITEMTSEIREVLVEHLTKSLDDLMLKLEKALVEQFGKTFVEFNEAVQSLKKWQEDHREHVEDLSKAYREIAGGIQEIRVACAQLPETATKLNEIVTEFAKQTHELNTGTVAFVELREQAKKALPEIKEHFDRIGEDLQSSASGFASLKVEIAAIYAEGRKAADEHAANVEKLVAEMTSKLEKAVTEITQHTTHQLASAGDSVTTVATSMRQSMEQAHQEASQKVAGTIEEALKKFDDGVQGEYHRITDSWVNLMISIVRTIERRLDDTLDKRNGGDA